MHSCDERLDRMVESVGKQAKLLIANAFKETA